MKILDIPQSGKLGLYVSQGGRYGQIRRILAIPANPRTEDQLNIRQLLGTAAHNWKTITETQRLAWSEAAKLIQTRPRLGQSGPLTGLQLYIRINLNLSIVGEPTVATPPAAPVFESNVVNGIELTNPGGVVAVKLTCAGDSAAFNLVWASPPQSAGRLVVSEFNYLGELPEIAGGKADITALYTAKYGAPAAGQKVFVRSKQMLDGYEDLPHQWSGIVPAAS
jgi:hypothetical protein